MATEQTLDGEGGAHIPRKLGWKKNPRDSRDRSMRATLGAPTALAAEWYGLMAFVITAMDQTNMSACVGFALGAALMTRLKLLGIFVEAVSVMAIYAWARMVDKPTKDAQLDDSGCQPRSAMQALSDFGAPPERVWPIDPSQVDVEMPWDVQQLASAGRITQYFRLDSDGTGRVHDIMHALMNGYPVVFGTFVDSAFMSIGMSDSLDSATVFNTIDTTDPRGGGHMLCIVAYRTNANGQIEFLILNSWGLTWGYRGMAWMSQDIMMSTASDDFYAFQCTTTGDAKKPDAKVEPKKEAA